MKKTMLLSVFMTFSCSFTAPVLAASNRIFFASYNVENLFDAQHDAGKADWEFLPLAFKKTSHELKSYCQTQSGYNRDSCFNLDWSQDVLNEKLSRVADTILSMNNGQGPDMIMMPEVENSNVLHQLNTNYLKKAGYQTEVLIEGMDNRGIDVAFLSRYPLVGKPVLHQIQFSKDSVPDGSQPATRGILEVQVKLLTGEVMTVFGVHFPSQAHPHTWREDGIATLDNLLAQKSPNDMVLVGGDFNITKEEESSSSLFHSVVSKNWSVSHIVGCQQCKGTEVYHNTWSFLDVHLYSQSLMNGGNAAYTVDVPSITAYNKGQYQLLRDGTPARYKVGSPVGVSDHLPMVTELVHR